MALKIVTPKTEYTSTIKSIQQGKDWEGDDKVIRTEYKVELANGQVPIFNIKTSDNNPNRTFPYKSGDIICYDMTEKEQFNKIRQFGNLNINKTKAMSEPKAEKQTSSTPTSTPKPLSQQESIALSVSLKLAKETFDSELWQSYNKIQVKGKTKAETEEKTKQAISAAKQSALQEIGQITRIYFKTLTTKVE